MALVIKAPLGAQSFGQVSLNLLREILSLRDDVRFFPEGQFHGGKELSSFDLTKSFLEKLNSAYINRYNFDPRKDSCLRLWHINGSENKICNRQILYTFHETSQITNLEKRICSFSDKILVSSSYTKSVFESSGLKCEVVNPGFDPDITLFDKSYFPNHIHFGIMGKLEKRKHTVKTIKLWAAKFGNNPKFKLTCVVYNPFLTADQNKQLQLQALDGKEYWNITFLPFLPKNSMVSDFMSSIDVDLTGLSGGEGWNLPAFNCTALGKWSIVLNATAHKDWANKNNCILVEPSGTIDSEDGIFFKNGTQFNQGHFYNFSDEDFYSACEVAMYKKGQINYEGKKLVTDFSYSKSAQKILEHC